MESLGSLDRSGSVDKCGTEKSANSRIRNKMADLEAKFAGILSEQRVDEKFNLRQVFELKDEFILRIKSKRVNAHPYVRQLSSAMSASNYRIEESEAKRPSAHVLHPHSKRRIFW